LNLCTAAREKTVRNKITKMKNNEENEQQEKERNRNNISEMRKIKDKKYK